MITTTTTKNSKFKIQNLEWIEECLKLVTILDNDKKRLRVFNLNLIPRYSKGDIIEAK